MIPYFKIPAVTHQVLQLRPVGVVGVRLVDQPTISSPVPLPWERYNQVQYDPTPGGWQGRGEDSIWEAAFKGQEPGNPDFLECSAAILPLISDIWKNSSLGGLHPSSPSLQPVFQWVLSLFQDQDVEPGAFLNDGWKTHDYSPHAPTLTDEGVKMDFRLWEREGVDASVSPSQLHRLLTTELRTLHREKESGYVFRVRNGTVTGRVNFWKDLKGENKIFPLLPDTQRFKLSLPDGDYVLLQTARYPDSEPILGKFDFYDSFFEVDLTDLTAKNVETLGTLLRYYRAREDRVTSLEGDWNWSSNPIWMFYRPTTTNSTAIIQHQGGGPHAIIDQEHASRRYSFGTPLLVDYASEVESLIRDNIASPGWRIWLSGLGSQVQPFLDGDYYHQYLEVPKLSDFFKIGPYLLNWHALEPQSKEFLEQIQKAGLIRLIPKG